MAFQGTDGFSVYDREGRMAFRVDNYSRKSRDLVLMDGAGRALLAIRPQVLSIHDRWNAFKPDPEDVSKTGTTRTSHIFTMRRRRWIVRHGDELDVFMGQFQTPSYSIEGCFWRRNCRFRNSAGEVVAQICRKKVSNAVVLDEDVFSLVVQQGVDVQLMMRSWSSWIASARSPSLLDCVTEHCIN